ncbi:MAG: cation-transporting P-type ATPase [Patescibacteria group bacterium]
MLDNLTELISNRSDYQGLTAAEAEARLKKFGANRRPPIKGPGVIGRFLRIVFEPMIVLLLLAAVVYFFIGDNLEAIILILSIGPVILIQFFQEQKTNQAINVLDKMLTEFCMVYRDGQAIKMEMSNVVPGDLVYITAGDKVPADGIVFRSSGVLVDESILTGEAMAVVKSQLPEIKKEIPTEHILYQGTLVIQGEAVMLVDTTGVNTKYGHLGSLLNKITKIKTPLQQKIHDLVKVVGLAAFATAFLVFFIIAIRNGMTAGLLGAITVAMAIIPEEFPVVFSVFLIMGVWRMTKEKALIREMATVELLGTVTVICTDKTGTLTRGKMTLKSIYHKGKFFAADEISDHKKKVAGIIESALLALERVAVDPIELEVQEYARRIGIDPDMFYQKREMAMDSAFNAKTKLVSHVWKDALGVARQYTAGAPESILKHAFLSLAKKNQIESELSRSFNQGYRVIGVAERDCGVICEIKLEKLKFIGFLVMEDLPRPGVKEAISLVQNAGIKVIMITGDNKLTARNIADQIGLNHDGDILDGEELKKMSPPALAEAVKRHSVFARVEPEQKYDLVQALQEAGEIVAMTGDGVNDAPALRRANIGIAMGNRGTEVARAAAGMVLLDDNFATIAATVKEGRRIYDNLRQAFVFLFSFHLPIVGLALLPLLLGQPFIFFPVNIIFLELFCDPVAVLGFDRERARRGLMNERPRPVGEPLIKSSLWWRIGAQGLGMTIGSFGLYWFGVYYLRDLDLGRTMAFCSLIFAQVFSILFSREWQQVAANKLLLIISFVTVVSAFLLIYSDYLRIVFHLVPITLAQIGMIVATPLLIGLLIKLIIGISLKKTVGRENGTRERG